MLPKGLPLRQESATNPEPILEVDERVFDELTQRQKTIDIDMLRRDMEENGELLVFAHEDMIDNIWNYSFGDEDQLLQTSNVQSVAETTSIAPTVAVPLLTSPMDQIPHSTFEHLVRPKIRLFPSISSFSKQRYDRKLTVVCQTQETDSTLSRIKVRYICLTEKIHVE